ncbi:hypothetical protein KQX54_021578 [Cotesia glomerata]|uniref:Uncharacterized protein n=1 Tax=Cotesia glomerata TaxID=32391 RepID=A0AAV7J9J7_COTGL|nr:hypothetical protein KQX54_021578 [Cotesia glomerata]
MEPMTLFTININLVFPEPESPHQSTFDPNTSSLTHVGSQILLIFVFLYPFAARYGALSSRREVNARLAGDPPSTAYPLPPLQVPTLLPLPSSFPRLPQTWTSMYRYTSNYYP